MNEEYFILSLAKNEVEKKLHKAEKKARKTSEKLRQHDPFRDTQRKGTRLRINAECAAEERDRWINRLSIINNWMEVLK